MIVEKHKNDVIDRAHYQVLQSTFESSVLKLLLSTGSLDIICYFLIIYFNQNVFLRILSQNVLPIYGIQFGGMSSCLSPLLHSDLLSKYCEASGFYNSFHFSNRKFIPIIFLMHQVPVVDGYSYPHLTKRMNVAGRHITSYLVDLLSRRG